MSPAKNLTGVFKDLLRQIEADAKAVGLKWTAICKEAGLSRATPDRWKKKTPNTVALVTKIEEIVARHKTEDAAPNSNAAA